MTKTLQRRIVIGDAVAAHLGDAFTLEELDEIAVRGREQKVRVYEVRRVA